jgi:hypothetical protein
MEVALGALSSVCLALFMAVLVAPMALFVGLKLVDAKEMSDHRRDILGDTCLKCGENVVADVSGHYRCRACSFDTAALGARWDELSELRSGLSQVREARFHLARAARYARWNRFGLVHSSAKYRELEEASRLMMDGHDLLRDLAKTWPELLELPDPQSVVDPDDAAADIESGGGLGVLLQLPLRGRIAEQLARGLRDLDAGLAVVEGLVGGIASGDETDR